jgi:GMP synthase-like glutamine amidotransferase
MVYTKLKVAILDMYEGATNQGMRCIKEILNQFAETESLEIDYEIYDVRLKNELPEITQYDFFISSGGPGSPIDSTGTTWETNFFNWIDRVDHHNKVSADKKQVFFICHSFQLACKHFGIGTLSKRKSTSFGVFPVHMELTGHDEPIFQGLQNPFFAVDSREYQVTHVDETKLHQMGGAVLALEKIRPHIPLPRAVMAIRFNEYFFGTQFHPEADAMGMSMYLQTEDRKKTVIASYGEEKWSSMIEQLNDPEKILWTYSHILPNFIHRAIGVVV